MADRWLTIELEPEPERPPRPLPERGTGREGIPIWTLVAATVLAAGAAALLVGAWMTAASGIRWNGIARDAAAVRHDLGSRSQVAAAALTDELAGLESTSSTLGEVSAALDDAADIATGLEAMASGSLPSGPDGVAALVREIDRLAGAIDDAFPGLADLGVAESDGPGSALEAAGAALMAVADVLVPESATGFGPFVLRYPLPGYPVTSPFGTARDDGFHGGVDIAAPARAPILAADDGVVLRAGWLDDAAGNGVILVHEQGWETRYFHMLSADLPVAVGDEVAAGQVIGYVGSTGDSTGPHLHFEIVFGPIRMDPLSAFTYLGTEVAVTGPAGGASDPGQPAAAPPPDDPVAEPDGASTATESDQGTAALSGAPAAITAVRQELLDIGADASDRTTALEQRRIVERDRGRVAALILYAGAVTVVLGLLMVALRPRRGAAG